MNDKTINYILYFQVPSTMNTTDIIFDKHHKPKFVYVSIKT